MKQTLLASLIGASLAATCVMADEATPQAQAVQLSADHAALIEQVTKDVEAAPEKAAEIVKKAIEDSKADAQLVAQIVKAAILASPDQIHEIYCAALAVAPDSATMTNLMIVAMLNGDEVAAGKRLDKKTKILQGIIRRFLNTTDISVDDDNKDNKVLVESELLNAWSKDGTKSSAEVKLDNFTYLINFGRSEFDSNKFEVIILKKDTPLTN